MLETKTPRTDKHAVDEHGFGISRTDWVKADFARQLETELAAAKADYNDLIFQVCKKVPGETRHETAKRIIMQHEQPNNSQQHNAPVMRWRGSERRDY